MILHLLLWSLWCHFLRPIIVGEMRLRCSRWLQCDRHLIPGTISFVAWTWLLVEGVAEGVTVALFNLVVEVVLVYGLLCLENLFKLAVEISVASIVHIIISPIAIFLFLFLILLLSLHFFLQRISLWLFEHIWGEARLECSFFFSSYVWRVLILLCTSFKVTQVIALSVDLRLSCKIAGIWRSRLKDVMIIWLNGDGWSLVPSSFGLWVLGTASALNIRRRGSLAKFIELKFNQNFIWMCSIYDGLSSWSPSLISFVFFRSDTISQFLSVFFFLLLEILLL